MSTDHNFWRERRAEAPASNRGPSSAYQPNALPLGQTSPYLFQNIHTPFPAPPPPPPRSLLPVSNKTCGFSGRYWSTMSCLLMHYNNAGNSWCRPLIISHARRQFSAAAPTDPTPTCHLWHYFIAKIINFVYSPRRVAKLRLIERQRTAIRPMTVLK